MRRTNRVALAVACAAALAALSACGSDSGGGGGEGQSAGGTIKIGILTSMSGSASAGFTGVEDGAQARLDAYKDSGGKCADTDFQLVTGDDTSSPEGALTATQNLVQQQKVFAVLPSSSFFYGAGQYAGTQASGTPFVGAGFDGGPQWQNKDYTNLFASTGSVSPSTITRSVTGYATIAMSSVRKRIWRACSSNEYCFNSHCPSDVSFAIVSASIADTPCAPTITHWSSVSVLAVAASFCCIAFQKRRSTSISSCSRVFVGLMQMPPLDSSGGSVTELSRQERRVRRAQRQLSWLIRSRRETSVIPFTLRTALMMRVR